MRQNSTNKIENPQINLSHIGTRAWTHPHIHTIESIHESN